MSVRSALPKQWRHWLRCAHLRSGYSQKWRYSDLSMVGRGRNWRVVGVDGTKYKLQMSEPYAEFDRWANSMEMEVPLPRTRDEFINAVKSMVDLSRGGYGRA